MSRAGSIADNWTGSDKLIRAMRVRGGRRVALESAIRGAIRSGDLRPSDPIPSSRALARELGVARGTVAEAYGQLAAEGYLTARPGAPTRVAEGAAVERGSAPDAMPCPRPRPRYSLEMGVPDVAAFPRTAWAAALRRALAKAPAMALALGDPRGAMALREALATHLRRTRGVVAEPGRIVITCGFSHGLALLCNAFRGIGIDELAMEDPCLWQHRTIVAGGGVRVRRLPVDEQGASSDPPAPVRAALVTPAHQFPLGMTLAPARRTELAAWARAQDGYLVEDDYDGEYRYDHQPIGALQGLDPARVVYAGTVSKTLAPGLRLGWLVLPYTLVEPVLGAKEIYGADVSAIEQLAMADLLACGAYDRHVRRTRLRYRKRRDALVELLAERAPGLVPRGIAAGLHVVLDLPSADDERLMLERAAERGLALDGLGPFWHDPAGKPAGLAIGYAASPDHAYAQTLAALASVLDALGHL